MDMSCIDLADFRNKPRVVDGCVLQQLLFSSGFLSSTRRQEQDCNTSQKSSRPDPRSDSQPLEWESIQIPVSHTKKTEAEQRQLLCVGAEVEVLRRFKVGVYPKLCVRRGDSGVVIEIDNEGDAKVQFSSHAHWQWLTRDNIAAVAVKYGIVAGSEIEVITGFWMNEEPDLSVEAGDVGSVLCLSGDSGAWVQFDRHAKPQHVASNDAGFVAARSHASVVRRAQLARGTPAYAVVKLKVIEKEKCEKAVDGHISKLFVRRNPDPKPYGSPQAASDCDLNAMEGGISELFGGRNADSKPCGSPHVAADHDLKQAECVSKPAAQLSSGRSAATSGRERDNQEKSECISIPVIQLSGAGVTTFRLHPDNTVAMIRARLAAEGHLPGPTHCQLVSGGEILSPTQTLTEAGIVDSSVLVMMVRRRNLSFDDEVLVF